MKKVCALFLLCAVSAAQAKELNQNILKNGLEQAPAMSRPAMGDGPAVSVREAEAAIENGALVPEGGYAFKVLAALFNKGAAPTKEEMLGVYKGYSFSDSNKFKPSYLVGVKYDTMGNMFENSIKLAVRRDMPGANLEDRFKKEMEAYPFATPLKNSLKTTFPSRWDKEARLEVRKYGKYLIVAVSSKNFFGFRHGTMSYYYERLAQYPLPPGINDGIRALSDGK